MSNTKFTPGLIAAAPELLSALRLIRLPDVHAVARKAIVEVIAKATGEAL